MFRLYYISIVKNTFPDMKLHKPTLLHILFMISVTAVVMATDVRADSRNSDAPIADENPAPDYKPPFVPQPISLGMKMPEVVKNLGPADSKLEYEVSRKEMWFYKDQNVLFLSGKVAAIKEKNPARRSVSIAKNNDASAEGQKSSQTPHWSPPGTTPSQTFHVNGSVESLLGDIAKESGPEGPSTGGPQGGMNAGMMQPPMNPVIAPPIE